VSHGCCFWEITSCTSYSFEPVFLESCTALHIFRIRAVHCISCIAAAFTTSEPSLVPDASSAAESRRNLVEPFPLCSCTATGAADQQQASQSTSSGASIGHGPCTAHTCGHSTLRICLRLQLWAQHSPHMPALAAALATSLPGPCVQGIDDYLCAKMHLVDLAGSERAKRTKAEGARLKVGPWMDGAHLPRPWLAAAHMLSLSRPRTCLVLGCAAGRMPLARCFYAQPPQCMQGLGCCLACAALCTRLCRL